MRIQNQFRFRLKSVTCRLLCDSPDDYQARLKNVGLAGNINTAYVERVNLALRWQVAKLMCKTWSPAQHTHEFEDHLFWRLAVCHFVRPHECLKRPLNQPIPRHGGQTPRRYICP